MKKIITICVFTVALLFSSQSFAQKIQASDYLAKSTVKEDVKNLSSTLRLSTEQMDAVEKVFLTRENALNPENSASVKMSKADVDKKFTEAIKDILTDDQYTKFKSMTSN